MLAGCASAPRAPVDVAKQTQVSNSEFDARITYQGPQVRTPDATWRLRAWRDKATGEVRAQLYVTIDTTGDRWRGYRSASFDDTSSVQTVRIDTDVACRRSLCMYSETVGVPLDMARLSADRALRVRLNSQAGVNTLVEVPADYLRGFLEVLARK